MPTDCFIVMPISTPKDALERYGGDADHFLHVLEHLFEPAIKKAELNPIRPIFKGAALIQAEIIRNIEKADLVLCDMSLLNPNVFFELGIRTAINKPVCLVRDHLTAQIPFDTGIINTYTYSGALNAWELEAGIDALAAHIRTSRESESNEMWRYFSLSARAALDTAGPEPDRLELLALEMKALRSKLEPREPTLRAGPGTRRLAFMVGSLGLPNSAVQEVVSLKGVAGTQRSVDGTFVVFLDDDLSLESERSLRDTIMDIVTRA